MGGTVCGLAGNWGGSRGRERYRGAGATPEAAAGTGEARRPAPSTAASTAPSGPGTQPRPAMKQALGPGQGGCAPRVWARRGSLVGAVRRAGSQVLSALAPTTLAKGGAGLRAPRATEEPGGHVVQAPNLLPGNLLKPQVRTGVGGHVLLPNQQRLVFSSGSCSPSMKMRALVGRGEPRSMSVSAGVSRGCSHACAVRGCMSEPRDLPG